MPSRPATWVSRSGWPDPVAFLDGVQHSEVVGYAGSSPIVVASVAAAVRERNDAQARHPDRRGGATSPSGAGPRSMPPARRWLALERIELADADPPHPIRELAQAGAALDDARGALEVAAGVAYRSEQPQLARRRRVARGKPGLGRGRAHGRGREESFVAAVRRGEPRGLPPAAAGTSLAHLRPGLAPPGTRACLGGPALAMGGEGPASMA